MFDSTIGMIKLLPNLRLRPSLESISTLDGSEIPNNHLTCMKPVVKNGILTISTEPRKKPSYFPLYWLVNRDPHNGLL